MKIFGSTAHERIVMAALVVCAASLPVIIPFAHKGAAPMILLMGLAVASRGEPWRRGASAFLLRSDFSSPLVVAALAATGLALWIALAGLWAPRADAPRLALNVAAPVLAGGALVWEVARRPRAESDLLSRVLAAGAAAAILILLFEALTGGLLRALTPPADPTDGRVNDWKELGRGATVASVSLFGALLLIGRLTGRRLLVAGLFAAALAAAIIFDITSNAAAIVLGALAFASASARPKATIFAAAAIIVAALLLAPLAAVIPAERIVAEIGLPLSWAQRLFIWREGAHAALDCLPFGCGPDYARALRETVGTVDLPGAGTPLSKMPVHPHSIFLQLWLETGLPGVVLFGIAVGAGAVAAARARLSPAEKAAIAATAAAMLVSALVEASLWQVWRLAVPALAGLFIALAAKRREEEPVERESVR